MKKYLIAKGNEYVTIIEELNICKCGCPNAVYKLIHTVLKEIKEKGPRTDDTVGYYDFMIYQLNHMEFLDHGTSIYNSWITEKGNKLIEALDEMAKYDYEYDDFSEANLVAGDR